MPVVVVHSISIEQNKLSTFVLCLCGIKTFSLNGFSLNWYCLLSHTLLLVILGHDFSRVVSFNEDSKYLSYALRQLFFDSKDSLPSLVNRDLGTTKNSYWPMFFSRFSSGLFLDKMKKRIINFLSSFETMTRSCNLTLVIYLETVCVGRFFFFT